MNRPIEQHPDKQYLGDGAFVMPGSYLGEIVLTTDNGIEETNRIHLDRQGFDRLRDIFDRQISAANSD